MCCAGTFFLKKTRTAKSDECQGCGANGYRLSAATEARGTITILRDLQVHTAITTEWHHKSWSDLGGKQTRKTWPRVDMTRTNLLWNVQDVSVQRWLLGRDFWRNWCLLESIACQLHLRHKIDTLFQRILTSNSQCSFLWDYVGFQNWELSRTNFSGTKTQRSIWNKSDCADEYQIIKCYWCLGPAATQQPLSRPESSKAMNCCSWSGVM